MYPQSNISDNKSGEKIDYVEKTMYETGASKILMPAEIDLE